MKRPLTIIITIFISVTFGGFLSAAIGWPSLQGEPTVGKQVPDLPVAAKERWFPPVSEYRGPLDEEDFERLLAALDKALIAAESLDDFEREADLHLWNFTRRLGGSAVTEEQEERVLSHLANLAEKYPDHRAMIENNSNNARVFAGRAGNIMPFSMGFRLDEDYYVTADEAVDGAVDDAQMDGLLTRLDEILKIPETVDNFEVEAPFFLWQATKLLQRGPPLSPEQAARFVDYFEKLKMEHPNMAEAIERNQRLVDKLLPGRVAPNIVGKDTEGVEFALEAYRGNIVVLYFSGEWCVPCRAEYPYQRAMMDLYEDMGEAVVLLSVNSDDKLDTARAAKKRERLRYRTWWDRSTKGPIATDWNVNSWPVIYILDEEGVVRHTGKRGADIIVAVDQLLAEKRTREFQAKMETQAEEEAEENAEADR